MRDSIGAAEPSNARRFLDAFHAIEEVLEHDDRKQGGRSSRDRDHESFANLVDRSRLLEGNSRRRLRAFARLRNAIAHHPYRDGEPIADPRLDVVEEIERIRNTLLRPPLIVDVLATHPRPRVLRAESPLSEFLDLVADESFSQAPVELADGFGLITTNAVARWFASNLREHGGVIDEGTVSEVMEFAEDGDGLRTVNPMTTAVEAIRLLSGEAEPDREPPAALLVLGAVGQSPQKLCSRADLGAMYAALR